MNGTNHGLINLIMCLFAVSPKQGVCRDSYYRRGCKLVNRVGSMVPWKLMLPAVTPPVASHYLLLPALV